MQNKLSLVPRPGPWFPGQANPGTTLVRSTDQSILNISLFTKSLWQFRAFFGLASFSISWQALIQKVLCHYKKIVVMKWQLSANRVSRIRIFDPNLTPTCPQLHASSGSTWRIYHMWKVGERLANGKRRCSIVRVEPRLKNRTMSQPCRI